MNKSIYDHKPSVVEKYDGSQDIVNLNIKEVQREIEGTTITEWEADTIIVSHPATYSSVVDALVKEEYAVCDELALLRQKEDKAEDFAKYNTFVEKCKETARQVQ